MTALHSIPLTLIDGAGTDFGRFKGEVGAGGERRLPVWFHPALRRA